jgi:hypothetical protein
VRRWHERVAPILADPPRPRPPTEADAADDVFAFFMRSIVLDDGDERDMATVADQFLATADDAEACEEVILLNSEVRIGG